MNKIWVRFGLWIAVTVLVTVGILGLSVAVLAHHEYKNFYNSLPDRVRQEVDVLRQSDQEESPRAVEIYTQYWDGDLLFGESERWALLIGLLVCLPFGMATGFWVSRLVTQPLNSMAEAAKRVALGDFTARAEPGRKSGEMADMVRDFNHMTDALQQLESERKATTAAVSHELRTPLTVLRARLHAVCDGVITPDQKEFRTLLDQVEHLGRLVDDLHTLSMADAGRLSLRRTEFDLVPLVADALAAHADLLAGRGIQPELRLQTPAAWIDADPDRMRQVISNLIDNAQRHANEGGWLEIEVAVDSSVQMAVLTVSDAGAGLPEEVRKSPFQRFSKARTATGTNPKSGSGLGLSIVSTLVTRQGGSIHADTSARGGSRFTISMPMLRKERSAPAAAAVQDGL